MTDLVKFIDDLRTLVGFKTIVCHNRGEFLKANEWIRGCFDGYPVEFVEFECHGLTSMIIKPRDSRQPRMIGDGHIEVVAASDEQFTLRADGDRLWGRGTADMKTQVLAMVYVLRRLLSEGDHHDFWLVLTEDEEVGSEAGVVVVIDHLRGNGLLPPVVFAPDGGPNFGYVEKEKGIATVEVATHGTAAHASRPYLAVNAIERMCDLNDALQELFPAPSDEEDWRPSVAITRIDAGTAPNRIPDVCSATFNLRLTEADDPTEIEATVARLADRHSATVESMSTSAAAYYPKEAPVAQVYLQILEQIVGHRPRIIHSAGASNGRHYAAAGDVHVLMSNPMACGAHGESEWVAVDSLMPYLDLVYRTATMEW